MRNDSGENLGQLDDAKLFRFGELGLWHVVHTKSRQEKALAEQLGGMGVTFFLPLLRQQRTYGGRKAVVEMPLFPGYLFLKGSVEDCYAADRTSRVAQIIPVADQEKLTWELRNLAIVLGRRAMLDPFPRLVKGIRVEVRSGPLQGLQGVIEERAKSDRLILQVNVLGQATSVEIDGSLLEVIE